MKHPTKPRSRWKPLLRWLLFGSLGCFLAKALHDHWQQVAAFQLTAAGWACLAIALGITLLAHLCAAWVWRYTLRQFRQPVGGAWVMLVYLKTNLAKYLPGNVWHYYGRVSAATQAGAKLGAASVSVLLEPLLMAAAALLVAVLCSQQFGVIFGWPLLLLQAVSLIAILAVVHPRSLNGLVRRVSQLKASPEAAGSDGFVIEHYPWVPLLGQLVFVLLRGAGFWWTVQAVQTIALSQVPIVLGAFSLAWLLGLVIPLAPGGLGVFEATLLALLHPLYPPAALLSMVAFYRLISLLSEAGGAGLAWLAERRAGMI